MIILTCECRELEKIKYLFNFLIERNYDFNCKNKFGENILHNFFKHLQDFEIIKYVLNFLFEQNFDFNCKNNSGETPIQSMQSIQSFFGEKRIYELEIIKYILDFYDEKNLDFHCETKKNKIADVIFSYWFD